MNEWIVTWIQHQLPRAPLTLFDAIDEHPWLAAQVMADPGRPANLLLTIKVFGGLLADRKFVGYALASALALGSLFGYVAGASFVLQGVITQQLMPRAGQPGRCLARGRGGVRYDHRRAAARRRQSPPGGRS